jgi:divalent metal cation (Fe/Co/Zn/Cd) transporter
MKDVERRYRASYRVIFVTLWVTLLVLAVKFWASWTTQSLSILADFLHTLLAGFSVVLSLNAITTLRQIPGQQLRTHQQLHTISVLLLTAVLGFIGFTLLVVSLFQVQVVLFGSTTLSSIRLDMSLVVLLGVVLAVYSCLILFERYESTLLGNPILRQNANFILQGIWLTGLMLAGLVGILQGYTWLDPVMTIVLVLMLIPNLWRILKHQLPSFVEQIAIAPESLYQIVIQIEGVSDCYKIYSQGMVGRQVVVRMYLLLHPEFMNVAHLIGERLEGILRERYGAVKAKIYVKDSAGQLKQWQDSLMLRNRDKSDRFY